MTHHVYILRCADGTLYTGYATDVEKRLREHNGELKGGATARYTRGRRPVSLLYTESFATRSEALKREYAIKQLSKDAKLALISVS
jgi:putative endonuclease